MAVKILLVDDMEDTHELVKDFLDEYPAKIISAKNGRKAVEALKDHGAVDLILLDLMMPAMDGYELLDVIRRKKIEGVSTVWEPGMRPEEMAERMAETEKKLNEMAAKVPVIIISAKDQKADVVKARKYNIAGYLAKPFSQELLVERITSALGGRFTKSDYADVDRLLD